MTTTEAFEALMPEPVACAYFTERSGGVAFTSLFDRTFKALKAAERVRLGIATSSIDLYTAEQMRAMFDAATERAAKQEREECAKLCDQQADDHTDFKNTQAAIGCDGCAAAIRGRHERR